VTDLQVRRIEFDFGGDDVPFEWNTSNPVFSVELNFISVMAVAFEKFIVAAVREALPKITDPEAKAEANAFLQQEAVHAGAHRKHLAALTRRYPGFQRTIDEAVGLYDELTRTASLEYRLAYIADLEATFTPIFKLWLDNEERLFRPGDDRVASVFLWHFVEEVEHRSSALIVYNAITDRVYYRTRILPSVVLHLRQVLRAIGNGFNEHIPVQDRTVDGRDFYRPSFNIRNNIRKRLPFLSRSTQPPVPAAYAGVPRIEIWRSFGRILASQTPHHNPTHQPLPDFADKWFGKFDEGADIAHWYSTELASSSSRAS
jgi:predicted metal-dependent hydrolase